jgi:hypothetical protein
MSVYRVRVGEIMDNSLQGCFTVLLEGRSVRRTMMGQERPV